MLLPKENQNFVEKFEKFYKLCHNETRFLTWIFSEGNSELTALLNKKKYLLIVSNLQLTILMYFNDNTRVNYAKLLADTKISDKYLQISLYSLCLLKILSTKSENIEKICKNDEIWVNDQFISQQKRIVCISSKTKKVIENPNQEETANQHLEQDRGNYLDSVIVRIMKSRKKIKLLDLLDEVVKLITLFRPQPNQIKKRIESLIERTYIKRDDNDYSLFIYLP